MTAIISNIKIPIPAIFTTSSSISITFATDWDELADVEAEALSLALDSLADAELWADAAEAELASDTLKEPSLDPPEAVAEPWPCCVLDEVPLPWLPVFGFTGLSGFVGLKSAGGTG